MYGTSTALTQLQSTGTDIGTLIAASVVLTLGGWAALTGVGFARRKIAHYVSGRKF